MAALVSMESAVATPADTSERSHNVLRMRREWRIAEKRSIVAETRAPGASISAISRQLRVAQNLIYQWRKLFPATNTEPPFCR